jgi:hypothetical protein
MDEHTDKQDEKVDDTITVSPNPKCKKCYGRGNAHWDAQMQPVPCLCVRKAAIIEAQKRGIYRKFTYKVVPPK